MNTGFIIVFNLCVTEPKKDKTNQSANGALSPSGDIASNQDAGSVRQSGDQKPNRPSTLEASRMLSRRLVVQSEYLQINVNLVVPVSLENSN